MNYKWALATLALLMLTGCAARRGPQSFRALLSPNCLTAPIVMKDCDFSIEPPRCRHVQLEYRKVCEQIEVKQAR